MDQILYFDTLAGMSGDMVIAALLDLGVDSKYLKSELAKLNLSGYQLEINKKQKSGITGIDFKVKLDDDGHHHRNLSDVEKIINGSELAKEVKELSLEMFRVIAKAEAKVHDKDIEEIHFHEVGALDSIVDLVGAAICIDKLAASEIYVGPLPLGSGFVDCAHGKIPVPAPATIEILTDIPVYSSGVKSELVTPTGAAIAVTIADKFSRLPEAKIKAVGYGLGDKELEITNLLRVFKIEKEAKKKVS